MEWADLVLEQFSTKQKQKKKKLILGCLRDVEAPPPPKNGQTKSGAKRATKNQPSESEE